MKKVQLFLLCSLLTLKYSFAQDCDCKKNFEWVKKTFEENDAGFEYALKQKGTDAYAAHNKRIAAKTDSAATMKECGPVLYEWLTFFRPGHLAISLNEQQSAQPANKGN